MPRTGPEVTAAPWALAVLAALGATSNGDNALALDLWAQSEGAPGWRHNWLNTTLSGYGGVSVNSVGVKAYPTFAAGVKATAATLSQSNMSGIRYALVSGLDIQVIYSAINASPWCGGCQGGHYPVVLYNYLRGLGQFPGTSVVAGTRPPPPPADPPAWDWSAHVRTAADQIDNRRRRLHAILGSIRRI